MIRKLVSVALLALLVAWAGMSAAQSSVGDDAPAAADTILVNADNIITSTGAVRILGGGGGIEAVDVMCDGDATFYLYDINSSGVITRRYGPFYTRAWMQGRSPIPPGGRADMLHLTALTGSEFIVTPRGN